VVRHFPELRGILGSSVGNAVTSRGDARHAIEPVAAGSGARRIREV